MEDLIVSYNMGDCAICCETYNLKNHKKVQCSFCDFASCRTCVQQFLLSTSNDPHCMECKNAWNREFVDLNCTKGFRNKDLKSHRETILLEREKCLLPQSQAAAARRKQEMNMQKLIHDSRVELDAQRRRLEQQRQAHDNLINQLYRMQATGETAAPEGSSSSTKKTFVRKCPIENCKGFLNDKWSCGLCSAKICKHCNEPNEGEGHVCDPNNVETVTMLNKDTKPCPACGTMIFKISGCNQMWCPDCHTAFDWRSGRIETGVIHNPHFYEFQRRMGGGQATRNLADIPCGGIPTIAEVVFFLSPESATANPRLMPRVAMHGPAHNLPKDSSPEHRKIYNIHQTIFHMQQVEIPQHRMVAPDNSDLRVSYLLDQITEEQWKRTLQQREKKAEKNRDITNVLEMYVNAGGDYLRQLVRRDVSVEETIAFFRELVSYYNNAMIAISNRYNCVIPYIFSHAFVVGSGTHKDFNL